jgi:hypothetical protein
MRARARGEVMGCTGSGDSLSSRRMRNGCAYLSTAPALSLLLYGSSTNTLRTTCACVSVELVTAYAASAAGITSDVSTDNTPATNHTAQAGGG